MLLPAYVEDRRNIRWKHTEHHGIEGSDEKSIDELLMKYPHANDSSNKMEPV